MDWVLIIADMNVWTQKIFQGLVGYNESLEKKIFIRMQ